MIQLKFNEFSIPSIQTVRKLCYFIFTAWEPSQAGYQFSSKLLKSL